LSLSLADVMIPFVYIKEILDTYINILSLLLEMQLMVDVKIV
jgi:hypothetical protein